jgi:hypothetical protein
MHSATAAVERERPLPVDGLRPPLDLRLSDTPIVNDRADLIKAAARTTPPARARERRTARERGVRFDAAVCSSLDPADPVDEAAGTTSKAAE